MFHFAPTRLKFGEQLGTTAIPHHPLVKALRSVYHRVKHPRYVSSNPSQMYPNPVSTFSPVQLGKTRHNLEGETAQSFHRSRKNKLLTNKYLGFIVSSATAFLIDLCEIAKYLCRREQSKHTYESVLLQIITLTKMV